MKLELKLFCAIHQTELKAKESHLARGTNIEVTMCPDCAESIARKNFENGIAEGKKMYEKS
jgi:uncharacterized protein YlaI